MTGADLRALLLSFAYVLALLLTFDFLRRRGASVTLTRKAVHIGVGMWVLPTLFLFVDHWAWALVPPVVFAVLNALSLRFRFFGAIEVAEHSLGTVLFPLSFAGLLAIFWPLNLPVIAAAGVMAMTWGDAMASLVGQAYGQRSYSIWGQHKTWLGSLACFSWTTLALTITLRFLPLRFGGEYEPVRALLHAALAGLAATVAEALSPKGTDNLFVPFAAAGVLYLLLRIF
jgi:phytol kinase